MNKKKNKETAFSSVFYGSQNLFLVKCSNNLELAQIVFLSINIHLYSYKKILVFPIEFFIHRVSVRCMVDELHYNSTDTSKLLENMHTQ